MDVFRRVMQEPVEVIGWHSLSRVDPESCGERLRGPALCKAQNADLLAMVDALKNVPLVREAKEVIYLALREEHFAKLLRPKIGIYTAGRDDPATTTQPEQ